MPKISKTKKSMKEPAGKIKEVLGRAIPTPKTEETTPAGKAIKKFAKVEAPKATFEQTGQAIVLARLAEDLGMHVPDVSPEKMTEAGLPAKLDHWIVDLAHRLNRNAIEASLWRNNRPMTEKAPEPSWEEAKAEIAKPTEAQQYLMDLKAKKVKEARESGEVETSHSAKSSKNGSPAKAPTTRTQVFGFAATAVVRALGKKGIAFDKVRAAMIKQGVSLSDSTLKIQLRAGATSDASRGEPAKLTSAQEKQLLS